MTLIEEVFLGVLYAMYLYDCVYWLAPGEQAFTRLNAAEWKTWRAGALSFTLLGRLPVLAGPLLLRPGFVRVRDGLVVNERSLRKVGKRLDALYSLRTLCRGQAFFLLVYVPALLVVHRLAAMWHVVVGLLVVMHGLLCVLAVLALRSARPKAWLTPASSLVFNPLGATRALDVIAQAFFEQQVKEQQQQEPRRARSARKP